MSLETDVQNLTAATTSLLNAVNVSKATLDQSVNDAAAQVSLATTQATNAAASAATATTKAGEAAGSAASALAIYGNTAAQQAAVTAAQNAASVAAGHAASASSVVQQDLSGVNAAALHRSPNAVTAMFVYDTSKDSDGGAWTEKCQHTSWYNEAINGKWLGPQASEAAARAVSGATTGDYFQLTTDGKFYRLNDTSGITETFRGNKRDFPRLAGIVAEGNPQGNERQNIVIYDLTEPNRPMWMVFYGDVYNTKFVSGGIVTCISAINGVLASGNNYGSPYYGGFRVANFAGDWMHRWSGLYGNNGRSIVGIGYRNSNSVGFPFGGGGGGTTVPYPGGDVASGQINAVAMTVLPDAPVDPVTGLKVPTIAVGTGGGLSIIKHNGTVVSQLASTAHVVFAKDNRLWAAGSDGGSYAVRLINKAFTGVEASFANIRYAIGAPYIAGNMVERIPRLCAAAGNAVYAVDPDTYKTVNILRSNNSKKVGSSVAYIRDTFNTGHQFGDIRRCFLSDIDAGSVSGQELVTNGTFDTDTTGWQLSSLFPQGTVGWEEPGSLRLTNNGLGSSGAVSNAIPLVVGRTYRVSFTKVAATGNSALYAGYSPGATILGSNGIGYGTTPGTFTAVFTAASNVLYVTPVMWNVAGTYADFDNISVQEIVADRSYKAQGATITGTLTKSAVASAAQLVAYSGFSASNYMREPYSADLDFGTGEWSVGAWVNVPVTLPAASFPVVDGELVNNGTGWVDANSDGILDGWTLDAGATTSISNGVLTITPGGGYSGISQTISTVPGKVYRVRFEKLNAVSCHVMVAGEGFLGANGPGSGGSGIAEGQFVATSSTTSISITVHPTTGWGPLQVGQISVRESVPIAVADRSFSSGPSVKFGVIARSISYYETAKKALLIATAFDGTTTRTVTTTAAYNTATWAKAEAYYTTDGTLSIRVNGQQVAATYGTPLLTLNNSNAVLTIGNSYNLDAPFPGSIALLKLSATVPTPEQSVWMYEQEKQLFRDGSQCCLPDSGAIVDLTYDDATDKWIAVSAANESEWSGLVRTSVTPVPAGSYTKAAAASGVQLLARSTTSPGVDITIPAYGLREELVKRAESAARLNAQLAVFDYVGGFTASTTNGSTSITSVAGLTYPASYIGAQVTGSGIPAGTVITGVSGTTIYLSAAATATATGVQISFTDFALPVGYEAKAVLSAGSVKTEGSTKDYTRLFDGFRESIRFGTAPGYQAAVQIQATRSAA